MDIFLLLLRLFSTAALAGAQIPLANGIDKSLKTPSLYTPILKVSSPEGFLPESAEMGTTVRTSPSLHSESLQILVQDDDLKPGMPAATYEYILTGLGASIFAVDQQGYVYLNVPSVDADPPNPSTYQLNIEAREVNTTPIRSSEPVSVTIHIMDVNDNAPTFSSPIYTANVSASGPDRPVIEVFAVDNDAGKFANIEYKIASVTNGASAHFRYDTASRQIIASGQLTPGERYQIVLEARDGGGLSRQAVIIVLAIGDPPEFSSNTLEASSEVVGTPAMPIFPGFGTTQKTTTSAESSETIQTFVTEVSEATPPHSLVVSLGDDAMKGQTYFTIVGGNDDGKFTINEDTGTITTVDTFDRETTAMYSLQIEARSRNPNQHLYWTVVQVAVLDVNDNSPDFSGPQPIRILVNIDDMEELKPNMVVGRVVVNDFDSEDNGRVQLKIIPPMDKLFSITNDGTVSVNGEFTSGHFGEHRLGLIASDHGDPPLESRANLIITIEGTLITQPPVTNSGKEDLPDLATNQLGGYQATSEEYPDQPLFTIPPTISEFITMPSTSHEVVMPIVTFPSSTAPPFGQVEANNFTPPYSPVAQPGATRGPSQPVDPRLTPKLPTTLPPLRLAPVFEPSKLTVLVDENEGEIELTKLHAFYPDKLPGSITYVMQVGDPTLFSISSFTGSLHLHQPLDAESESTYEIRISTAEAAVLSNDPNLAHTAVITVKVADVNDWIPNFETNSYSFTVNTATVPGTIIGQVIAFDQDRDEPNNKIQYRLVNTDGTEAFSVNSQNGLITLKREIDSFVNEKLTLRIEASDGGDPKQASQTLVMIDVEPAQSPVIPKNMHPFTSAPRKDDIQFSLRNYTASVSEAVRPPHLVQILSVLNKPTDTRFVVCAIASGNYRGAFGVSTGTDGNCELRTQMELDRETVERYLLNVTVTAGPQTDFALVGITVLDANDNVPRFIYDNDLGLVTYFSGVASNAGAFTRVTTVKAEDADLGNSSVISYTLDPLSVDSKFFTMGQFGEITTKMSMSQVLQKNRQSYFEIRASACDSPVTGQMLCSKADVVVNVITDAHRFVMTAAGMQPQQLRAHEKDIVKALRQFTGPCTLINVEKMIEQSLIDSHQIKTDIYWYAVNPTTKKICKKQEFRKLFDSSAVAMMAGKLQPWFTMEKISDEVMSDFDTVEDSGFFSSNFKAASVALIVLAVAIAVGALGGICAICICYSRYKVSQRAVHAYPNIYPMPKFGTIFLPNAPAGGSHDKIYETQMLELPISDEDFTVKGGSHGTMRSMRQNSGRQNYRNYGRNQNGIGDEGDFSIEESMYAINVPGRIDPVTKRIQTLVIPAPDYPVNQKKSML